MEYLENFFGNAAAVNALKDMIRVERIPQTILLSGPEGAGKATLARRFAAVLLGGAGKIEQDDLSLEANAEIVAPRSGGAGSRGGRQSEHSGHCNAGRGIRTESALR